RDQAEVALRHELESRVAEQIVQVKDREARYRALMDGASDAILLANPEGYVIEVNKKAVELMGYEHNELIGMHFSQLHPPEILPHIIKSFDEFADTKRTEVLSAEILRRDGGRIPVDITSSVIEVGGETIVQGIFHDVQERLEAEQAIKSQNAFRKMILENLTEGLCVCNAIADYPFVHFTVWNPQMEVITGYSQAEINELGWYQTLYPDPSVRAMAMARMEAMRQGENIQSEEWTIRHRDGSNRIVSIVTSLLETGEEPINVLGVMQDITERKQVELALQESETRFRRVFVSNAVGMMFTNFSGQVTDANDHFLNIIGYSRADLEAHRINWAQITPPEYVEADQRAIEHLRQYGEILPWEKEYLRPDGSRVSVLIGVALLSETDGRCVCVVLDISDRKRAEATITQQLRQQTALEVIFQEIRRSLNLPEVLRIATQQLQELLDGDRVIVFQVCHDGRSHIVEEAVDPDLPSLKAMHWDDEVWSQEVLEHYWRGQPRIIPDVMDDVWTDCLVEYSQAGQIRSKMVAPILQELQESESHRWVSPNDRNKLWGVLVVHACHTRRVWQPEEAELLQQVANQLAIAIKQSQLFEQLQTELGERQKAQQELTQRNEELIRATRLKDEFLANMSHELRTPLNAVLGMTEGLKDGIFGPVNDRQINAISTIERSGSHLLDLINDILDVAKIEADQMELHLAPTDLVNLCQNSISLIRQQTINKKQQLTVHLPYNLPPIILDERRIFQVLVNLLNNAVKFTPEGGQITLKVTPPAQVPNNTPGEQYISFIVSDNGIGISPTNMQKLFQPFVQIDSALNRQYQGTGLGLTLAKRIVELHRGEISLTSEEGVGSSFKFQLPYLASDAPPSRPIILTEQSISPSPVSAPPLSSRDSPLLLLAEDNEANIKTVSSYLKVKGYRISLAKNGLEAIHEAETLRPDLILMDIQMPKLDGLEAIKRIRAIPDLASMPIIAITALAMEGDRQRCLEAGATDYVTKPIKLKELAITIGQILSQTS
ncbi:PAS domain S-box protein, partial [Synechocystis salina LEGE 06155]|nr:PAS domain S-box protein [Synechocystis salina LEGE 06155]